jgi:ankyrin repeat protein
LAVKIGQDDIFRNVSKVSEDKNPADRFGRTPLHYAAKFGRVNLVQIMVKNGIIDLSPRTKMNLIAPIVVNETLDLIRYAGFYNSALAKASEITDLESDIELTSIPTQSSSKPATSIHEADNTVPFGEGGRPAINYGQTGNLESGVGGIAD